MTVDVRVTRYGSEAYQTLRDVVAEAKSGDPLSLVTLVVPNEYVGIAARRSLAAGSHGTPGIAAVRVTTLTRLAEGLSGRALAREGRRPATRSHVLGALRTALSRSARHFGPVAQHPATVAALASAYRDLRGLDERVRARLSGHGPVLTETIALCDTAHRSIGSTTFDDVDLLRTATQRVLTRGLNGSFVIFLPQPGSDAETDFLCAIATAAQCRIVVALTGDRSADAAPRVLGRRLGAGLQAEWKAPVADVVIHASDPDDEVRGVVRRVKEALVDLEGHRIAVFYGAAEPYARLLADHLHRAGIQTVGHAVRSLAETVAGRTLRGLLGLAEHEFRRDELFNVIADVRIQDGDISTSGAAWERISRAAGIVSGDDWDRARVFAQRKRSWIAEHPDADEESIRRTEQSAERAEQLYKFVTRLRSCHARMAAASTWRELAIEVAELWAFVKPALVGPVAADERRASGRVDELIATLGELDGVAGAPDHVFLRHLVELELDSDAGMVGRVGEGVRMGPVSQAIGTEADLVFLVGAAEGLLPARSSDDALIPDRVRATTAGQLPTRRERLNVQHHQVLAALASAPPGARVVTFPRGDLRRGGSRTPSRWVLPSVRTRDGHTEHVTDREQSDRIIELASYPAGVERDACPATGQEWRMRAAVTGTPQPADDAIERARTVQHARLGPEFTEFDGNVRGSVLPDPRSAPVSVTGMEGWVACPHGYFVRHLLGVRPVDQPENVVRMSALDRGIVLHEATERLVTSALESGWAPGYGEPWPPRTHRVLDEIADECFDEAENNGLTGYPILWDTDRAELRADLHAWVEQDDKRRASLGELAPIAAEWSFDDISIPLTGGDTVRLRGQVDRIDRARDGRLVVTDYKSGRVNRSYTRLRADPCDRGQRLQLAVYAAAVRTAFCTGNVPVRSDYWFITRRAGFERIGYEVDDSVMGRMTAALETIIDGIAHGTFPARPNDENNVMFECPACDIYGPGNQKVTMAWAAKSGAAELAGLRALLGLETAS